MKIDSNSWPFEKFSVGEYGSLKRNALLLRFFIDFTIVWNNGVEKVWKGSSFPVP